MDFSKIKVHLKENLLAYLALIGANTIWGLNFVIAKITLQEFPVMSLGFLRFFAALILISPFLLSLPKKERKIKYAHLPKLFLLGLFLTTLHISLFFEGLKRTTSIDAATLSLLAPVLSLLLGWIMLREKIFWINLLGAALSIIGCLSIIGLPVFFLGEFSATMFFGNILIILSALFLVIGLLLSKEMLKTYNPLITTTAMFAVGSLTFLVPAVFDYLQNPQWIENITIVGLLGFLFITFLSSVTANFFLQYGISKIEFGKSSLFQYMQPAVAALLAVPILHERVSFSFIIGTTLIILGVYWGTLGKYHHHHLHHHHHRS